MMAKFQLKSKEDVRLAIRKRGNEIASKMSDREIFTSEAFKSYAERLADFILRKHRLFSLQTVYEPQMDTVAFTDGKKIFWNTGNSIAAKPKLLERRFKTNMGILFHECAHKLFLDFSVSNKALNTIHDGSLYGTFPTDGNQAFEEAHQEMKDVVASGYGPAMAKVYGHICNCLDDGHDENSMKKAFPGFIADCIKTAGEVQMETAPTLSQMISDRWDDFSIFASLILQYAKYGIYQEGEASDKTREYLRQMYVMEPTIDQALSIGSYKKRWNVLNLLMMQLWPFIRDMFPKNKQDGSNGAQSSQGTASSPDPSGQGNGANGQPSAGQSQQSPSQGQGTQDPSNPGASPTPEEVMQAIEQLCKAVEEAMNANPAPINGTGKSVDISAIQNAGMSPGSANDISSIAQGIAQSQAEAQVQSELDKAQMDAIRSMNVPLIHKDIKLRTTRHFTPDKDKYNEISKEIAPFVRNLVKEMKDLLRELNEECVMHHRAFGPIVEATESYRPDNKFFAKKKLPDDLPNMSMCVLLDQSGSMGGQKLEAAIRTVILLEQFASSIGIPVMIAGHSASYGRTTNLRIFNDYLSAMPDEDRYALAAIQPGGCNRDGLPIKICAEMLSQRTEDVRLMVIISDGAPNDDGYGGEEAMKDITDIVQSYRRKGLLIYGAAIDDDKEVIQDIYGKGFLSIQNLASLPKTLVRLIRQQII